MSIEVKPEKLKEIAEHLDMGMLCFYNTISDEVESYPEDIENSDWEDVWSEVTDKIKNFAEQYIQITKMDSREGFNLMESFVNDIDHTSTRNKFKSTLSQKKPFSNFNNLLSYCPELRGQWFAYKLQRYIEFVKDQFVNHKN